MTQSLRYSLCTFLAVGSRVCDPGFVQSKLKLVGEIRGSFLVEVTFGLSLGGSKVFTKCSHGGRRHPCRENCVQRHRSLTKCGESVGVDGEWQETGL